MECTQTNADLTLEEVQHHFQQWRNTRQSRRERIPNDLLAEAVSLLDKYPQTDILRRLGLNRYRLLSAASLLPMSTVAKSEEVTDSPPFVHIPWPSPEATIPCLEIEHTNGMTLRLQNATESLVAQMVKTFIDHGACSK